MDKLILFTAATPNGWKVSIMLEELKHHGVALPELEVNYINLMAGEQYTESFTAVNPNQKIPALSHGETNIMESCAILEYLAEQFPTSLLPFDKKWQILPWLYWQAANVGPAFGNRQSYIRYMSDVDEASKRHPQARFLKEARRLAEVLENQLQSQDYICGDQITIADIATYPWIRGWKWSKVDMTDRPNIMAWLDRMRARPGVAAGLAYGVPKDEVDQWSEATKARYAKGGASISKSD